jgi:hypothetical protein
MQSNPNMSDLAAKATAHDFIRDEGKNHSEV